MTGHLSDSKGQPSVAPAAATEIYLRLDRDGTIRELHGATPGNTPSAALIGKRLPDIFPPEAGSRLRAALDRALSAEAPITVEYPLPPEAGEQTGQARLIPFAREIVAVITNVTARKREGEISRLIEAGWHDIFRSTSAGMVLGAPDGSFIEVNPAFCSFLGYSEDELQKLTVEEITHPEDREMSRQQRSAPFQGISNSYTYEKRYLRKDGSTVWGQLSSYWFHDEDGKPIYAVGIIQDITERKRMEEALRESEAKFAKAFHATPTWLVISTVQEGRFIEINDAFERICGYRRGEVIGRTALELNIWESLEDRKRIIETLLRHEKVRDVEVRFRGKTGKVFVGMISAELVDINGEQCVLTLVNEITARKLTEEALRESEARFRRLYNDTPAMLHSIDRDGKLVSVSNYWLDVLGYERSEVLGRKSTEFLTEASRRHAEDVTLPEFFRTGVCRDVPYQVVTKGGVTIDVLLSAIAEKNHAGETVRSLAVMTEVTERKRVEEALRKSEEKFSKAFHATPSALAITTLEEGRFVEVNEAFVQVFGYRAEEVLGRSSTELAIWQYPQDRQRMIETLRNEGQFRDEEIAFRHRSGKAVVALYSAELIELRGEPCLLSLVNDITTRKELEGEIEILHTNLACRAAELEAANRELEAFSHTVSHDLRSPLTGIVGFSDLLLETCSDRLDEKCRGYLQQIQESSQSMDQLITVILDFSRLSAGEIIRETVDLSGLAGEIALGLRLEAPLRQVEFRIAEGVTVTGDGRLLRVMMQNLLGNAWKYTAKKAAAEIEFGVSQVGGKTACFVRDNGAGFDMALATRLFGAFQRLHNEKEFTGHGIGLATVERIIRRHGGRVWAEGEVDKGACFYFTLP
ncbi:MAG TPA: PAS domain S-box protein [Geobacteraceae bacterium]